MNELPHLDDHGRSRMIDIGGKAITRRTAIATGRLDTTPAVLELLKQRAMPAPDGRVVPAAAASAARSVPVLPTTFYPSLLDRMVDEQAVSAEDLAGLAQRRAQAIASRLTGADGVGSARVTLAQVREARGATDKVVPLKLELQAAP